MKMDMQQMFELLLANQEKAKANQARMEAKMDVNQAKAAKQEEILAELKADQEKMLAEISARMTINLKETEADKKRDRENLKGMMEEMNAKMDCNQAEMRSTVCAMWSMLEETIQHEMKAVIQHRRSELDEMTTCNEATETEPDPGMMQSTEEHQEIPKGEAAVMPGGEPRKQSRVCNLAAECHQKRKERTWGNSESRRKSAAACRKVSRCAKVA
jgi:type IV secretory pathway VirB4 component